MPDTILELFDDCVHRHGGSTALRFNSNGVWEEMSWKAWWADSERFAAALVDLGVERGDRVAILCETRAYWVVADIGIMMAGAVVVPLYPSAGVEPTAHILADAAPTVALVEDPSQLDKIARAEVKSLETVILIEREANFVHGDWDGRNRVSLADVDWPAGRPVINFETFLTEGRRALADDAMLVAGRRGDIAPDDLATIVYTSGTEFLPKGVVLKHSNLYAEAIAMREHQLLERHDVQLLFLPLAHIFARALMFAAIAYRIETVIGRGPGYLLDDARATSPTFFAAVPQIFERLQLSIETEARQTGGWRRRVLGVATGREQRFGKLGKKIASELVRRRIESSLGANVRFMLSGGAPLAENTCRFFLGAGVPVIEGYGLTETTAVTCANHPDDVRPGTVGRPLHGVEVAIDEDGEILVRGETVTSGYYGRNEAVRDEDGWFATGDLGQFDRDGYLTITGRKKEMIVTSGGKNIAPAPIETTLRSSSLVADAHVHGDRRPHLVALIVPNPQAVLRLAEEEGVVLPPRSNWNDDPWIRRRFSKVIDEVNERRARFEAIRTFAVLDREFHESAGEKTPTGKHRRDQIVDSRTSLIESLYRET